ncbi:MAG: hypothetical protein AB8G22_18085 [Saprospiraceae bacterium]
MKNILLGLLIYSISTIYAHAQMDSRNPSVGLSVINEQFGVVPPALVFPANTGAALTLEWERKNSGIYRKKRQVELGYLRHAPIFQAAYLAWKPKYEWQFNNGFQLHTLWGIGYLHAFPTEPTYVAENGVYTQQSHRGKPGGMAVVGAGLGYQMTKNRTRPLTFFVRQEWMIAAPFKINEAFPASLNALLRVGVSVSW